MKRRFILLDHSIEDSTGHYLEYATRVLRAAKLEGFETILATNKRAAGIACPEADSIDNAFCNTFWENQTQSFSMPALRLLNRFFKIANKNLIDQYTHDLGSLLSRIQAKSGDLIFIPTSGRVELLGLEHYARLNNAHDLKWHLLFRRDLPEARSLTDTKERLLLYRTRAAFLKANRQFCPMNLRFYTDTEELTARHDALGAGEFSTLPIPIDDSLGTRKSRLPSPFVISYIGDAREEKGFHLLPNLITKMRSAGFDETQVQFRIQANMPLRGRTARSLQAKLQLIDQQETGVALLEGPFNSETYAQIILVSDIVLIPYCSKSYTARSSGIFAEALAAGVPTIYPEASWMAKSQTGSGSLGFRDVADIPSLLIHLMSNYTEHESKSIAYSQEWRVKHSARSLVCQLANNSIETDPACEKRQIIAVPQ
jgi:hypothetical protein